MLKNFVYICITVQKTNIILRNEDIMEKELEVLQQIQENGCITQRDLARNMGLSLGNINLLMRKMISTGLIKIEKLNAKKIRYILTPEGMAEKAAKTYNYVVKNYNNMLHVQNVVRDIVDKQYQQGIKYIYLYGETDEVFQIVKVVLDNYVEEYEIKYKQVTSMEQIKRKDDKVGVFVWDFEKKKELKEKDIESVNVLESI